jgi:hypothetical protein
MDNTTIMTITTAITTITTAWKLSVFEEVEGIFEGGEIVAGADVSFGAGGKAAGSSTIKATSEETIFPHGSVANTKRV